MAKLEIKPDLERQELIRHLGGRKACRLSYSIQTKIEELSARAVELIKPVVHYQSKRIERRDGKSIALEGGISFRSQRISKTIGRCEEVICFIATIGNDIEREITKLLAENHLSEAYILDAMGSVAVENLVEKFHGGFITENERRGRGVTLRFSPGYCDWSIRDQRKIFSLFESDSLEVELTDSYFMRPRKSISGIFGIALFPLDPSEYNPCLECPKLDCTMRRI